MQEKDSGKKLLILTFDLEEWFHILDIESLEETCKWSKFEARIYENAHKTLRILEENNLKATFFVLGWIARKYAELVRLISEQGHDVGTHSQNHYLLYKISPKEFREDLKQSLDVIQNIINKKVRAFRAPGFSIKNESLWAFEILGQEGIEVDSSIFRAPRGHGGLNGFPLDHPFQIRAGEKVIKEFPINMFRLGKVRIPFSGGGYFRLMPCSALHSLINKSDYVMTYFHMRDFDPGQPVLDGLPLMKRFKCYYGLKKSFEKFNKIINKYNFIDLTTAAEKIDWNTTPILTLSRLSRLNH